MDVNSLRSQLQFSCQNLQNLTTAELQECKWPTKKKVYLDLLSNIPSVREEYGRLEDLLEVRNQEMGVQRMSTENRDNRLESERLFRTNFLSIVLDCLKRLRWPPSLEAFSDPMNDLFHDGTTNLSAIKHILSVGVPQNNYSYSLPSPPKTQENINHNSPNQPTQRRSEIGSNSSSRPNSASRMALDQSKSTPRLKSASKPLSSGSLIRHNPSKIEISNASTSFSAVPDDSAFGDASSDSNSIPSTARSTRSVRSTKSYTTTIQNASRASARSTCSEFDDNSIQIGPANSIEDLDGDVAMIRAFEILQQQNEVLSRQLRQAQEAICARNDIEIRIETLMLEFKSLLDRALSSASNALPMENAKLSGRLTEFEEQEYIKEIQRIESEAKGALELQPGIKSIANSKIVSSNNIHSESSRQLSSSHSSHPNIHTNTIRGKADQSKKSTSNLLSKPVERESESTVGNTVGVKSTTSSESSSISPASMKKLHQTIVNLLESWNHARKQSRQCVMESCMPLPEESGIYSNINSNSNSNSNGTHGRNLSRPIDVKIHQVLGVRLAGLGREKLHNSDLANENSIAYMGLNLQRIHVLQKDLIGFAYHAGEVIAGISAGSDQQNGHKDFEFPVSTEAVKQFHNLEQLQSHAQHLSLHLACLAPLAPLSSTAANSHLTSNMTGLEKLMDEVHGSLGNSKASKQNAGKIQLAADRAMSEQQTLVRALDQSRDRLAKWPQAASIVAENLKTFGSKYKIIFEKSMKEINRLKTASNSLLQSYTNASLARVPSTFNNLSETSSNKKSAVTMVSPLDALSRGVMGTETASLVNALKLYCDEIENAVNLFGSISDRLSNETATELDSLNKLSKALKNASQQSMK